MAKPEKSSFFLKAGLRCISEVNAPPVPVLEAGGELLRWSSSSCREEVFRGEPVTDMLSLSKPASILLSFSLVVVVKGGDVVRQACVKPAVVVVGEP